MTARPIRTTTVRMLSALAVCATAILAACGAELPTSAELQGMDVAKAEARIGKAVQVDSAHTVYLVNGRQVAAATARGLQADSIATIEVRKVAGKRNEVRILTKDTSVVTGRSGANLVHIAGRPLADSTAKPMVLLDGVKSSSAVLDKLEPANIVSVEVVKGPAAISKYGPEGANGVIVITTKK